MKLTERQGYENTQKRFFSVFEMMHKIFRITPRMKTKVEIPFKVSIRLSNGQKNTAVILIKV